MGNQGGVSVLISDDINGAVPQWRKDPEGRVLSILFHFNSFVIHLLCIYAPATCLTGQKVFFETVHEYCLPADAIIFTGDFNCYEHKVDKFSGNLVPAKYLSDFRICICICNLILSQAKKTKKQRYYGTYHGNLKNVLGTVQTSQILI